MLLKIYFNHMFLMFLFEWHLDRKVYIPDCDINSDSSASVLYLLPYFVVFIVHHYQAYYTFCRCSLTSSHHSSSPHALEHKLYESRALVCLLQCCLFLKGFLVLAAMSTNVYWSEFSKFLLTR